MVYTFIDLDFFQKRVAHCVDKISHDIRQGSQIQSKATDLHCVRLTKMRTSFVPRLQVNSYPGNHIYWNLFETWILLEYFLLKKKAEFKIFLRIFVIPQRVL